MKDSLGSAIASSTMGITRELKDESVPLGKNSNRNGVNVKSADVAAKKCYIFSVKQVVNQHFNKISGN